MSNHCRKLVSIQNVQQTGANHDASMARGAPYRERVRRRFADHVYGRNRYAGAPRKFANQTVQAGSLRRVNPARAMHPQNSRIGPEINQKRDSEQYRGGDSESECFAQVPSDQQKPSKQEGTQEAGSQLVNSGSKHPFRYEAAESAYTLFHSTGSAE